jgi:hypothetical protein
MAILPFRLNCLMVVYSILMMAIGGVHLLKKTYQIMQSKNEMIPSSVDYIRYFAMELVTSSAVWEHDDEKISLS